MKRFGPYIVILIIIAVAIFIWSQKNKQNTVIEEVEQVNVEGVGTPAGKEPMSGVESLADLAKQGKSLECQVVFDRSEVEGNIEGTYFTDKGKLRGDFVVPAPEFGGKIISSMIVDTDMLFVWTTIEGQTMGFKTDLTSRDTSVPTKEPVALDEPVKYTCTEWDMVDGSVFIPPTDVTFTDTDVAVKAGMEYGTLSN
ncbi:MAG: hypothetical protein AAB618_02440 [Patescibacteria group bacterium]